MRRGRGGLLAAILTGFLAGPAGTSPAAAGDVHRFRFEAFASPVTVQITGVPEAAARDAVRGLEDAFVRRGQDWYAFGDGELARVNAALAAGERIRVSPELAGLLRRAAAFHERSGGRFDPAVGPLVALWGFDRIEHQRDAPPPADLVAGTAARRGQMADLVWHGDELASRRPVRLDLNGIAKGTAAALARERLLRAGIGNALVDIGGSSMVALGRRHERRWRIGIRHPRPSGEGAILASVELEPGEAVASSGDYERFLESGGRRYGHVLDPRTGWPVAVSVAATVLHPDPELAEAATKALMVAGPAEMAAVCRDLGIRHALVVGADGRMASTPAMTARLRSTRRAGQ